MDTGWTHLAVAPTANRFYFLGYLQTLQEDYRSYDMLILFVDGARYHLLEDFHRFILWKSPEVVIVRLSPYSQEYNPAEGIWKQAKHFIANFCYQTLDAIIRGALVLDGIFQPSLCARYRVLFEKYIYEIG